MFIAPVELWFLRRSVTYGICRSSGANIGDLARCYKHFASTRRRTPEPANVNSIRASFSLCLSFAARCKHRLKSMLLQHRRLRTQDQQMPARKSFDEFAAQADVRGLEVKLVS